MSNFKIPNPAHAACYGVLKKFFPLSANHRTLLALFFVTVLSRIPFRSNMLHHWDSVEFAMAISRYDITVHQPHPPGYFLYVMAGRLLNPITGDANLSYTAMSILFSGLAVAAVYVLASEIYGPNFSKSLSADALVKKTKDTPFVMLNSFQHPNKSMPYETLKLVQGDGLRLFRQPIGLPMWAALLAMTSPLYWFYGEVASTYVLEAFFATTIGWVNWRVAAGEHRLMPYGALLLALTGGIRQSTMVFMLPQWAYSVRKAPARKILPSAALFSVGVIAWFIPMLVMTGGWHGYKEAVDELYRFSMEPYTLYNAGFANVPFYALTIFLFTCYGAGLGAAYMFHYLTSAALRSFRPFKSFKTSKEAVFFSLWILPPVIYYLTVVIPGSTPGHGMIFMPVAIILSVRAARAVSVRLFSSADSAFVALMGLAVLFNIFVFLFLRTPVSRPTLLDRERDLGAFISAVRAGCSPSDTVILCRDDLYLGPKHFMYYLPEFKTYIMDGNVDVGGNRRKMFWGQGRNTYISNGVAAGPEAKYFVSPLNGEVIKRLGGRVRVLSSQGRAVAVCSEMRSAPAAYRDIAFKIE